MKELLRKLLIAGVISWCVSVSLGLLFVRIATGMPVRDWGWSGYLYIAIIICSVVAVLFTPLVMWAADNYAKKSIIYGVALYVLLAIQIVFVTPNVGRFGLYGPVLLAVMGLIVIGVLRRS
jgi:hypothetical protein